MDDVKEFLEQLTNSSCESDSGSLSTSVYEWKNNEYASFVKNLMENNCSNSLTSKKRNGEKRLPTRRPDPNVYNRNALSARENRRKKKVYLETIEKELQVARKVSFALAKELKRQLKIAQRLEGEISNHEEENVYEKCNYGKSTKSLSISLCGDLQSIEFDSASEDYNVDNLESSNLSTIKKSDDMPNFTNALCEATSINKNPEQKSDYIDVEGDCSFIGGFCLNNWDTACQTPPLQLLSE